MTSIKIVCNQIRLIERHHKKTHRAAHTRRDRTCTASSAGKRVRLRSTAIRPPTSRRASRGTRTPSLSTSRTQRSTFRVPRWPLLVSRNRRSEPVRFSFLFCSISFFLKYRETYFAIIGDDAIRRHCLHEGSMRLKSCHLLLFFPS